MENTALILIIITLFLLVIIVGLLTVLVFKLMKQGSVSPTNVHPETGEASHPDVSRSEFHPAIRERLKGLETIKPRRSDLFCPNHSDEPGEVVCGVCDTLFCKACVKPFKSMYLCKEHLPLVMRHDWKEILTLKTSTTDPERGVKLYDVKKELYQRENITTYVETHYKINVDQDYIETYLVLFGTAEEEASLKEKLKEFIL